ncbi:MAG: hypothetical protein JNN27_11270 [Planctomycetes bacterium]|nr:hypothetical protein [Planctomycetota bacterium]
MPEAAHNLATTHRGQPSVAAILTWLVPGAGHLYLGRVGYGLALFALIEGLYFLGLELAGGMSFEFLDAELRTVVAPLLSPEAGNLGGILWQMKTYGFGAGHLRPWPEHIVLGSALSAASGVLNAFAMVHAHTLARASKPADATRPVVSTLLGWVCPGLGHLHQGRTARGAIVFVLLVGMFALGTFLSEGSNLSRERHFYYWAGQFLLGGPALAAEALLGAGQVTRDIPYVEAGLVFGCVAGMLNILAMIDVYGYGEAKLFGWPQRSHSDPRSDKQAGSDDAAGGGAADRKPQDAGSALPRLGEIST